MPSAEHGLKKAVVGMTSGFALSYVINAISVSQVYVGETIIIMFNLLAILSMLSTFENMNYWSLPYSLGYFMGLSLLGRFFMESWELILYSLVILLYIIRKMSRKFG